MLKTFPLTILAVFFFGSRHLISQDLHISYDVSNGRFLYASVKGADTTRLEEPIVKKDCFVYLHLENFNPYTHNAVISVSGQDFLLPVSNDAPGSKNPGAMDKAFNPGFVTPDINLNAVLHHKAMLDQSFGGQGKLGFAADTYNAEVAPLLQNMDETEEEAQNTLKQTEKVFEARDAFGVASADIANIQAGRYVNLKTIRNISHEHLKSLFGVEDVEAIHSVQINNITHQKKQLGNTILKLKGFVKQYDAQIAMLNELRLKASKGKTSDTLFYNLLGSTIRDANANKKALDASLFELDTIYQHFTEISPETVSDIRAGLTEILTQTYRYDYPSVATKDQLIFDVCLTPKTNVKGSFESAQTIRLPKITVTTFGGIKVNSSAGIAFGSLFKKTKIFDVKDDKIVAGSGDSFTPMACTYFHFYWQSRKDISWGGSFGLGVPLSLGGNQNQSLAFLMGPSMFLGKNERFVLSFGFTGMRSTQLAKGYAIGDSFPTHDAELPTDHPYKWGYYLGFSFNLLNNP